MITIYHNPRCSKSREALALIEAAGHTPVVVEYLKTPPDAATLKRLLKALGISARELLRHKEAEYAALGLNDARLSEASWSAPWWRIRASSSAPSWWPANAPSSAVPRSACWSC